MPEAVKAKGVAMRGGWRAAAQRMFGMGLLAGLAGCVAPSAPPPPPPPAPAPAVQPAPAPVDWRDAPLTAGDWTYVPGGQSGSEARFGPAGAPPLFVARCDAAGRRVILLPAARQAGGVTITTSSAVRTLPMQAGGTALGARDSFLDAMAFSRGRFVVASAGAPALYIPAWPEFARVVEDCRG